MFSLFYDQLNAGNVIFSLLQIEPLISMEGHSQSLPDRIKTNLVLNVSSGLDFRVLQPLF